MLSICCCHMALNRGCQQPPQDVEARQPSNIPQQAMQRGQQPPLPLPASQQILGTLITYKNHETGETCDDCAICLEKFEDGDQCRVLYNCKHIYHKFCIDQWLARDRHCPLCRGSLRGSGSNHQSQAVN
ncbi:hypothetical protein REPUB_Repub11eG0164800 [Reevesia pubescens]